ncbi:MAG: sulfate transporter family protein [Pseudolabrys sp.]
MLDAVSKAFGQMLRPPLRAVLFKSIGLSLVLILLIGIGLQRLFVALAGQGAVWAEGTWTGAPQALWDALVWVVSIMASLGIVTGAVFLMPAVTAVVGSLFVDEIAEAVEREHYPAEPAGRALPFVTAIFEGIKVALLALGVYVLALPFVLFAGLGFLILFFANSYLLGREYFELAAMRFRSPEDAKALRRANRGYVLIAGTPIALVVSIPVVSLITPLFAMAYMVHVHKRLSGPRPELIEPSRPRT